MADVDFSDLESAEAWFEGQSVEVRCAMSSRAALRVFANFRADLGGAPDHLDMSVLRAILTSAGRGVGRPTDVDWDAAALSAASSAASSADSAADSAHSAASSAFFAARSADSAADSAALSARSADSAARSASSAARSASSAHSALSARSAAYSASAHSAAYSASAHSAASRDTQRLAEIFNFGVWDGVDILPVIQTNHDAILVAFRADPVWKFWLRFYEGMWTGTFDEWKLLFEVIKIDEAIWEKGVEAVAEEIVAIEARMKSDASPDASETNIAAYRPDNVVHLFQNAPQVRASFELSAETLNERLDLFQQMACWNEPIPLFEPLREMPAALTRAAEILATGIQTKQAEEALKDEVAKLRAQLATVEAELKIAKADIEGLKKKPWWKSATVVAGGSVIGAIVGTAWMVSGDELGPDKRWDMLSEYWEFVFSREELSPEPLSYQLPRTWDA